MASSLHKNNWDGKKKNGQNQLLQNSRIQPNLQQSEKGIVI